MLHDPDRNADSSRTGGVTISAALVVLMTLSVCLHAVGCEGDAPPEPDPPTAADEAAVLNGVEIRVDALRSIKPEVLDPEGHAAIVVAGADRVLAIDLSLKNTGESAVPYRPSHSATPGQPDTTPLLFTMPEGEDGKLTPVPPVRLGEAYFLQGQIKNEQQIAPGKTIDDTYIFRLPGKGESLMLTVPAPLVGGTAGELAKFELPNKPKVVPAGKPGKLGTPLVHGPVKITVDAVKDAYVEAVQVTKKPGEEKLKYPYAYTNEPILRVDVTLENTGKEGLYYDPGHRANDSLGVELMLQRGNKTIALKRYKLADANAAAKGQMQPTTLEPGKKYKDVFLFQRPPTSAKTELEFILSGHLFSVPGLVRFELPYEKREPSPPDLEPYKKDEKKKDDD